MHRWRMLSWMSCLLSCTTLLAQEKSDSSSNDAQRSATGGVNERAGDSAPRQDAKRAAPRRIPLVYLLDARVPEVRLEELPLRQVLDQLSQVTGATVFVNWQALQAAGIREDKPITVVARNLRFSQVLWMILREAAGPDAKLGYRISSDLLYVSTLDDLNQEMIVRVYPVADLVMNEIRAPALTVVREHDYVTGLNPVVAAGAAAVQPVISRIGSGVRLGTESDRAIDEDRNGTVRSGTDGDDERARRIQELINVITATIEPDTWDVNGGRGSIRGFRDKLVVRNTPFVHQQLAGELESP
ncbi:MAG: hypothetical protein U1D55_02580 [Phycisphaerae bacterium]